MRRLPLLAASALAMPLCGCAVEIGAADVVARAASPAEVQNDEDASRWHPEGEGSWVLLTALVGRKDVARVSRRELYSHVSIVECSTGKMTNVATDPRLETLGSSDFFAMRALLKEHPAKQEYRMQSLIFARPGNFQTPQCMLLRGGSYLGQKIVERRIPIRTIGALP